MTTSRDREMADLYRKGMGALNLSDLVAQARAEGFAAGVAWAVDFIRNRADQKLRLVKGDICLIYLHSAADALEAAAKDKESAK